MISKLWAFALFVTVQWGGAYSDCGVVTKEQWGGLAPTHVEDLLPPVGMVIIMHTATDTCNTDQECAELVRTMQNFLMGTLGYRDIAFSFIIGGNGKVYEGTGWSHIGAHTFGYNNKSIAISFIGHFNNDEPTPESLEAAKSLIKCGVKEGHLAQNYSLVGQRQLVNSESPGQKLYDEIRTWPDWTENVAGIRN